MASTCPATRLSRWRLSRGLAWSLRSGRNPGGPAMIAPSPTATASERTRSGASWCPHPGTSLIPQHTGETARRCVARRDLMPGKLRPCRAINAQRLTLSRSMPATQERELDLRRATLDDAVIVADLEAARDPEDPRDPQMLRFWWTGGSLNLVVMRLVSVRNGAAVGFVSAGHERWDSSPDRFGNIRVVVRADLWS